MRKLILVLFLFIVFSPADKTYAVGKPSISFDDFAPVKSEKVPAPKAKVKKTGSVVEAENAQDGLNSALTQLLESGDGVEEIVVPSGFAIISVASQTYTLYENRNATLIGKRNAYVKAMQKAKKELLAHGKEAESACNEARNKTVMSVDSGKDLAANKKESMSEKCDESVAGVLRGYVTYYTKDDTGAKTVTVALASSSNTRTAVNETAGAVITTSDVKKAWDSLIQEISDGLSPPVGARLIDGPKEKMIIAFGSAIIRKNKDSDLGNEMKELAKKQAQMRANNALVGFLKGDDLLWKGGFQEDTTEATQQLDVSEKEPAKLKVLEKTKHTFINTVSSSDDYQSVTKGVVPPGVKKKVFFDKNSDWAIAIAVYSPSATARAQKASNEMNTGEKESPAVEAKEKSKDFQIEGGKVEKGENPKGPSVQGTKDSDL